MKLQIIKTGKGYVAVNEQIPHQDHNMKTDDEGKWVISLYDSWIGTLSQEYRGLWRIRWKVSDSVGYLLSEPQSPENYRMIVATDTSFKLEGIPQFELEKKEYNTSLEEKASDYSDILCKIKKMSTGEWCYSQRGYIDGYKAAQEKGCYTEEDMEKAFLAGEEWEARNQAIDRKESPAFTNALNVHDFIDSLKQPKQLVGIEIVKNFKRPSETDISNEMKTSGNINNLSLIQTAKVIKSEDHPDGLLTVKQYYYENN